MAFTHSLQNAPGVGIHLEFDSFESAAVSGVNAAVLRAGPKIMGRENKDQN